MKQMLHPELTGDEHTEAMDADTVPPLELAAKAQETRDQPIETEQSEPSLGTFQPELGMPGYTLSLIGSADSPLSPITAKGNAQLDADPDVPGEGQSKATGARRPEGLLKSKMTLRK